MYALSSETFFKLTRSCKAGDYASRMALWSPPSPCHVEWGKRPRTYLRWYWRSLEDPSSRKRRRNLMRVDTLLPFGAVDLGHSSQKRYLPHFELPPISDSHMFVDCFPPNPLNTPALYRPRPPKSVRLTMRLACTLGLDYFFAIGRWWDFGADAYVVCPRLDDTRSCAQ